MRVGYKTRAGNLRNDRSHILSRVSEFQRENRIIITSALIIGFGLMSDDLHAPM